MKETTILTLFAISVFLLFGGLFLGAAHLSVGLSILGGVGVFMGFIGMIIFGDKKAV